MRKKKKLKKKKPQDPLLLSSKEESLLSSLLENLQEINLTNINDQIADPRIAQALVERLPADGPDTVNLILWIRDAFEQKSVQKAIKKTIFRIKQRGISIPELEPRKEAPLFKREAEGAEPNAYLGPIDGTGSRGVFIALPQIPTGVDLGLGLVNDDQGIIQFVFDRYSKKRMREVKELFFKGFSHMVEVSLSHAATILERAYAQSEPGQEESFSGYLQLRPRILENVVLLDHGVIYDFIPQESVASEVLTPSAIDKLLGHQLMQSWIIDPEEMKPVLEEIVEAEGSPILVSEEQRADRIDDIKKKGIDKIYPVSKRPLMKSRLEETAYIFYKLEEEEYARLSLAAAQSIDEDNSIPGINPFLRAMVERSLKLYLEAAKEIDQSETPESDTTSSIILP